MLALDRRRLLQGLAAAGMGGAGVWALLRSGRAQPLDNEIRNLKPGEYIWQPERSASGPLAVVVSLPDQRAHVYRGGIRIAASTCSTGKPGHSTPTGVFTVLQKDKHHHSSTYNNAPMPNMNRLTWSGVALHAGMLPGYPASHGCVRLPLKFSELLFTVTHIGTAVIIADSHSDPSEVVHPGMVLSQYAEHEIAQVTAGLAGKQLPGQSHEDNRTPPTAIIISRADQRGLVLENGKVIAEGHIYIKNPEQPLGEHVLMLVDRHDGRSGMTWQAISYRSKGTAGVAVPASSGEALVSRLAAGDTTLIDAVKLRMHPGLIMTMTDLPAHPGTRSDRDFVVMNTDES